jgi:hypothetical protein
MNNVEHAGRMECWLNIISFEMIFQYFSVNFGLKPLVITTEAKPYEGAQNRYQCSDHSIQHFYSKNTKLNNFDCFWVGLAHP